MSDKDPRTNGRLVFLAATNPVMLASGRRKLPYGWVILLVIAGLVAGILAAAGQCSGPVDYGRHGSAVVTCYPSADSVYLAHYDLAGGHADPYQASAADCASAGDSVTP